MNITAFGRAGVHVRDLAASERFYGEVLAMPVAHRDDRQVLFRIGESSQFVIETHGAAPSAAPRAQHIAFVVGNSPAMLDAAAQRLDERAVRYERASHEEFDSLYLRDPDGRLVELYYWPSW